MNAVPSTQDRRTVLASAAFGALLLLGAVLVIADAMRLPATDSEMGPAVVPVIVGVLLGGVGAGLLVQARMRLPHAVDGTPWQPRAGLRVLAQVGVLVAFALLLPWLGYVISTAGLFAATALLLGAPRTPQVVAYGWALAAAAFLVFDRLIGLSLPSGPWGF